LSLSNGPLVNMFGEGYKCLSPLEEVKG